MNIPEDIKTAFLPRPEDINKRSVGTVTVIGGSLHYIHAPVIAALGARTAGAGLIQLVVPDASRIPAGSLVPEATFTKLTPTAVPPKADVTVIGMGLGVSSNTELLLRRFLNGAQGRFVLDADALNILAKWCSTKAGGFSLAPGQQLILTPHEGEAARLLNCTPEEIRANRQGAILKLVDYYHAVVVLKGAHTLVAMPGSTEIWCSQGGNPHMALGGMGDLLAGVIAARWARLVRAYGGGTDLSDAMKAAAAGVWIHSLAADELVNAPEPVEPCIANVAAKIASIRIKTERIY